LSWRSVSWLTQHNGGAAPSLAQALGLVLEQIAAMTVKIKQYEPHHQTTH
jgi:hypothetical protein